MRRASSRSFAFLVSLLGTAVAVVTLTTVANAQVGGTLPPPPPPPPGSQPPPPPPPATTTPPATATPAPGPARGGGGGGARGGTAGPADGGDADDVPTTTSGTPHMLRSAYGLEAFWWSAKRVESALPIVPFAAFNLSPSLVLDVHIPVSFVINAHVDNDTKAVAGLGNPTLGLTYVTSPDARWTWYIGGRVSAPLAGVSDSPSWQTSNVIAAASMALYDLHYWAYKYLPIGVRGGFEFKPKEKVFLRGALEPTLYVPLDTDRSTLVTNTRNAELFYQLRLEAEGRSQSGWGGGVGLQLVHALTAGDTFGRSDNAQGAIEPFVSYTSTSTFARLGCLVALDSPFGFGFDSGAKVAALRLGVGSYF